MTSEHEWLNPIELFYYVSVVVILEITINGRRQGANIGVYGRLFFLYVLGNHITCTYMLCICWVLKKSNPIRRTKRYKFSFKTISGSLSLSLSFPYQYFSLFFSTKQNFRDCLWWCIRGTNLHRITIYKRWKVGMFGKYKFM